MLWGRGTGENDTTGDLGKAQNSFVSCFDHSKCHLIQIAAILIEAARSCKMG